MRKISVVALILFAIAVMASSQERVKIRGGVVTSVDDAAKTFTCKWKTGEWTFKTTDKTDYWIGETKGSWADVKVGAEVKVTSHLDGKDHVADKVQIKAPKTGG
jgi:hypothetical protein